MAASARYRGAGAWVLYGKFLLIFVPVFLLGSALVLTVVADRLAHSAQERLAARIGTQTAHFAGVLERHDGENDIAAAQDLFSTLLHDVAILCAEVTEAGSTDPLLSAPRGLGCRGQEDAEYVAIPVGVSGEQLLHLRFSTDEVASFRRAYREFALLIIAFGLLFAMFASYLGFRRIVARPLHALLDAIRRSDKAREPFSVPKYGSDELGAVIEAYNRMQENLAAESGRVARAAADLIAERRRNEELLSKVFQVSPYPFALIDPETGTYHEINEAWSATMEYGREEVIGHTAHELGIWIDPDDRARFIDALRKNGSVQAHETKVRTKRGKQLDTLISGELVKLGTDSRLFMVADDVTELKKVEEERRRNHSALVNAKHELEDTNRKLVKRTEELVAAQDTLVEQERLATLGELTATVSHELRNPLSAIRSSLHLALQKSKGHELKIDRPLERAERNIVRCDRIISDLLGYAKEPACESQQIGADDWLEEALSELEVSAGTELFTKFDAPGAQLYVPPDRIRQVVVNIFENAMQALGEMPADRTRILWVQTSAQEGRFVADFVDTGPGITPEKMERVFEPLFSTKSYGCGLGLATAKKIVEKYGGSIQIDSEFGIGTEVTIELPIWRADEKAA